MKQVVYRLRHYSTHDIEWCVQLSSERNVLCIDINDNNKWPTPLLSRFQDNRKGIIELC